MRLTISHETAYHYEELVRSSIQYLRLTPHDSERQQVLSWQLDLPRPVRAQLDPFGNILHVLSLEEPHADLVIGARGLVDIDESRETEHELQSPLPFLRFTRLTEADDALRAFASQQCRKRRDRSALIELMNALNQRMAYRPGSTAVDTSAAQAFAGGAGVCQDHTHAFLACARSLGVPARYVSGYLFDSDSQQMASHAWAEAWLEDAWYSFDVTNQLARPERHLKLAVGLDYLDACPVRGMRRGGGFEQMHAKVLVTPALNAQQQ
ncbi:MULTISPECIES: transglutaminase family protein [Pseudomonas]|uniref:Transglutaminase family protein n=1 Tax=Pseudomonas donghuensis TaxID=1163398 RepID=A0AAP0SBZ2_9PSED|nr:MULTISPECIES: transglutaminase family protein [Pseudomonas]MBS7597167.1 transglutaminase family protein [Pseudomonas sp. RC2C2]MDF9894706.1 transglutaminase-like putative cysteine protease [Pseudomonas vranovensis]KDN97824.1 transglutaminase family protein [Pseudomonas donghuensis]MBF4208574.1 transglutaminase family protein [Pseudomonas donghuensis]MCP6693111.1 transglutaminase family protein [Pseudomonas donghuensis]